MKASSSTARSWNGRYLRISPVNPARQHRRIHDAIARRAFQICNIRGGEAGHQLEDWQRAESEVRAPLDCGFLVCDNKINVTTDAACFADGEIEIYAEPRRLSICGKKQLGGLGTASHRADADRDSNLVFRYLELPFEIEPAQVTAGFKGRALEIDLPRIHTAQVTAGGRNAA